MLRVFRGWRTTPTLSLCLILRLLRKWIFRNGFPWPANNSNSPLMPDIASASQADLSQQFPWPVNTSSSQSGIASPYHMGMSHDYNPRFTQPFNSLPQQDLASLPQVDTSPQLFWPCIQPFDTQQDIASLFQGRVQDYVDRKYHLIISRSRESGVVSDTRRRQRFLEASKTLFTDHIWRYLLSMVMNFQINTHSVHG